MICFLIAMTWLFFDDSDVTTKCVLAVTLTFLVFISICVILVESAAGSVPGTTKYRVSHWVLRVLTFRWPTRYLGVLLEWTQPCRQAPTQLLSIIFNGWTHLYGQDPEDESLA